MSIDVIPTEVMMMNVLSNIPISELIHMRFVDRRWYELVHEELRRRHTFKDRQTINDELIELCSQGKLGGVQYFVSAGANIHARNDLALILAAENVQIDTVKYLISIGAYTHVVFDESKTRAVENGEFFSQRVLILI